MTDKPSSSADLYWRAILEEAPRVLSLMDREPLSPTVGCCDREYWAWKFVDFPRVRFQEALYVLNFLWATNEPSNPYFKQAELLGWVRGGLEFWCGLQHADG